MKSYEKRSLYESIMKDVAQVVKNKINNRASINEMAAVSNFKSIDWEKIKNNPDSWKEKDWSRIAKRITKTVESITSDMTDCMHCPKSSTINALKKFQEALENLEDCIDYEADRRE